MVTNPKTVSWANAIQAVNSAGATVAWDPTSDMAGIQISFDGNTAVSVPTSLGATSFNLTTLAAYLALPAGQHALVMADVTKEGAVGGFSAPLTFLIAVVPLAPTSVALA